MRHEILPFGIAMVLALAWGMFALWLLRRRVLGPGTSLNPFQRRIRNFTFGQSLYEGVAVFGLSLAIFDVTDRYFRLKLYGVGADRLTVAAVVTELIWSLFGGVLFGLLSAFFGP